MELLCHLWNLDKDEICHRFDKTVLHINIRFSLVYYRIIKKLVSINEVSTRLGTYDFDIDIKYSIEWQLSIYLYPIGYFIFTYTVGIQSTIQRVDLYR